MKILITALADFSMNPRPNRMVSCLKKNYDVTVIGYENVDDHSVHFVRIDNQGTISKKIFKLIYLTSYRYEKLIQLVNTSKVNNLLNHTRFDVIICHNIELLPLLLTAQPNAKIIMDVREYYPREFEDNFFWKLFYQKYKKYLCGEYLKRADCHLTVSKGLASEYQTEYGIAMDIMFSLPNPEKCEVTQTRPDKIRLIHHGGASPSRKTEVMLKTMDYVDSRFSLDLMLVRSNSRYYRKLKKLAQKRKNVRVIPPVQFKEIIKQLNKYDIGIFLCPPTTFNLKYTMPNKLFEFIQARLAVAVGPSPDMSNFVRENGVGVVSEDFSPESMAHAMNSLSVAEIDQYKKKSDKAAHIYNSYVNEKKIMNIIDQLSTGVLSP